MSKSYWDSLSIRQKLRFYFMRPFWRMGYALDGIKLGLGGVDIRDEYFRQERDLAGLHRENIQLHRENIQLHAALEREVETNLHLSSELKKMEDHNIVLDFENKDFISRIGSLSETIEEELHA